MNGCNYIIGTSPVTTTCGQPVALVSDKCPSHTPARFIIEPPSVCDEWQGMAARYSAALLAIGHHNIASHQAPHEYDDLSSMACDSERCLGGLSL